RGALLRLDRRREAARRRGELHAPLLAAQGEERVERGELEADGRAPARRAGAAARPRGVRTARCRRADDAAAGPGAGGSLCREARRAPGGAALPRRPAAQLPARRGSLGDEREEGGDALEAARDADRQRRARRAARPPDRDGRRGEGTVAPHPASAANLTASPPPAP